MIPYPLIGATATDLATQRTHLRNVRVKLVRGKKHLSPNSLTGKCDRRLKRQSFRSLIVLQLILGNAP